jgi:glycerol-3-phosphate dehydrogenase (NAD(P)+)
MGPQVGVVGGGAWGTTLASMCARKGPTTLWALEHEVVDGINQRHVNSRYLDGFELSKKMRATGSLEEATARAEVVVMAVPSSFFRAVLEQAAPFVSRSAPIVSVAKGFEPTTLLRMTEVIAEVLPASPRAALSGPNLAREVMAGYAAGAVVASEDEDVARHLQSVFSSGLYRVYTSTDVVGVEVAGALKNVFAIAAGMADGVGVGDNTRALVITRGLNELTRLGVAMGGDPRTFAGLAGLGDLLATCISPMSRNRRVGEELGKGRKLSEILAAMHSVAEGVHTCKVMLEIAERYEVEVPIARELYRVLHEGSSPLEAFRGLVRLPAHAETD